MNSESHRLLFETMEQGVVYQNASGEIISANPASERILGLTLDQMQGRTSIDPRWKAVHEDGTDFLGDTHPAMVALKTGQVVNDVIMGVFNPETQTYLWILINAVPQLKNGEDKPYQVYTTFNDITKLKQTEDKLSNSLKEKEVLIQEVHHRVKNNLQIISSLLSLQTSDITDEQALSHITECKARVTTMALMHEQLYRSTDLSRVNNEQYLSGLIHYLRDLYAPSQTQIILVIDVDPELYMGISEAISCGLIVNELVSNAYKYAFPKGLKGQIDISMYEQNGETVLQVEDNGAGLPQNLNPQQGESMGMRLVHDLTMQLDGIIKIHRLNPTRFTITYAVQKEGERG